jgi:transcriptional regulator with GAF, ATPase, and Fis domain
MRSDPTCDDGLNLDTWLRDFQFESPARPTKLRAGRFELAKGGTIFLDELGELSASAQVKLLRVLQSGEFERIGDTRTRKAEVRIVAATNRNLTERMKEGGFRADLFFRLNGFPITLPPLRERREDILPLAAHFIRKICAREGRIRHRKRYRSQGYQRHHCHPGH